MPTNSGDVPIKHCVERSDLVYPHRRHLQQLSDIVHRTDTRPSLVLTLCKVKYRDDCSLPVLGRILGDSLLRDLEVFGRKLEWDLEYRV